MASTYTPNKGFDKPAIGDDVGTWGNNVNSDWDIADKAFGGNVNYSLSSTNQIVSNTDSQNLRITLTGNLSADVYLIFPSGVAGQWIVANNTTGLFNVYAITSAVGSTGVLCLQSNTNLIVSDGTYINYSDSRVTGQGGATGGGSNAIFFENDLVVTNDYTIPTNKNAMTAGPITINSGVTVTINPPTVWTIV